jgi:hypothetical protein
MDNRRIDPIKGESHGLRHRQEYRKDEDLGQRETDERGSPRKIVVTIEAIR